MDVNRRGFLSGLLGVTVIAAMPVHAETVLDISMSPVPVPDFNLLKSVQAPPGWTYQWVRSALLGEPDPLNVQRRLDNGWTFVAPSQHPELPAYAADEAIEGFGLILMQKETAKIEKVVPAQWPPALATSKNT
jgi:hypothetical protein